MKKILLASLGLALGLTAMWAIAAMTRPYTFHGSAIDSLVPASDFALTDHNGQPFRLSEQTGQVVLLSFGYTHCPDVCLATLAQMKQIRAQLGRDVDRVQFLFITVDPERDTPEQLRYYLSAFDPAILGLTSAVADLETVWTNYGVGREKRVITLASTTDDSTHAADGYEIDHITRLYAIDPQGHLRLTYSIDDLAPGDVAQDVHYLLTH